AIETRAPWSARPAAIARPSPPAPPTTSATRPVRSKMREKVPGAYSACLGRRVGGGSPAGSCSSPGRTMRRCRLLSSSVIDLPLVRRRYGRRRHALWTHGVDRLDRLIAADFRAVRRPGRNDRNAARSQRDFLSIDCEEYGTRQDHGYLLLLVGVDRKDRARLVAIA